MTDDAPFQTQVARYDGMCSVCGRVHIEQGDLIVRSRLGWAAADCAGADRRVSRYERNIISTMEGLGFALGIPTTGSRLTMTSTRREFFELAMAKGLINEEQLQDLSLVFGTIWGHPLDD
jgi:hypothetical protein